MELDPRLVIVCVTIALVVGAFLGWLFEVWSRGRR